jgi:tetratricopeptide (TPR) repeat protein
MLHLKRGRASAFVLFVAIVAAFLGFDAGRAPAKDPSSQSEEQLDSSDVPSSSVAETARDVARYAVDASRTIGSALSDAALAVRRETGRARAAAQRARETIDEATDERSRPEATASRGAAPGGVRRAQAEASFARGNALLEARKYREARDRFAEAIALNPGHDRARAMLAWSQYFLADFRGAVGTFKTALARQPTWEGLSNGLGWSRLRVGRYQLAVDAFRDALERNPDYVDAWNGLGSALFERGDYGAALAPLERALEGYRRLPNAEPPEVTTLRGKIAWSLYYGERYREALAMFIRASLSAPTSQPLQAGMGWCYLQLGQQADARAAFQRAEKLGPNDEIVREGLRRASL